ncbi:DEKNAAC102071 [Brettanomyces naardenensis]|uniref:DEKNAAC102071 n=1 Tax=Brettanomyces naardenensis TaxID=13370 RepID=A0A448YJY3_BRENA|nr:DEKNAAC102071 [Brettanomyces naardenensis]
MGLNNPIPRSLKSESKKAAKVLASFIKPNQALGPEEIIPHDVLLNAKGLAIITVLKAGFLFSGRAGSGVVVARLPDGSWSAPSAIVTAGAGVGGQVGAEITDFVFILNTDAAVESFAQFGSVTLGGNVSVAAGPLGRNAEVAGSASLKNIAAVFSYSKTKGLFAGVSVEGSVLVERREANRKFYGNNCKARHILSGQVPAPPGAAPLMRILNSRAFTRAPVGDGEYYSDDDNYYDDIPSNFSTDDSTYNDDGRRRRTTGSSSSNRGTHYDDEDGEDDYGGDNTARSYYQRDRDHHQHSSTRSPTSWEDNIYDKYDSGSAHSRSRSGTDGAAYRPRSDKPDFRPPSQKKTSSPAGGAKNKAIALYSFAGQQDGDLPFKKGDVITIVQRSGTTDDWWTGKLGSKQGIFPANYVELV